MPTSSDSLVATLIGIHVDDAPVFVSDILSHALILLDDISGGLEHSIFDADPLFTTPIAATSSSILHNSVDDSFQTLPLEGISVLAIAAVNDQAATIFSEDERSESFVMVETSVALPISPPTKGTSTSEALSAIGGLDEDFYLSTYLDVAASGLDPVTHYIDFGAQEGRSPRRLFDVPFYLSAHPDVASAIESGLVENAVVHYVQSGVFELRDPNPYFDTADYLLKNPSIAQAGVNPLGDYIQVGAQAGQDPNAVFDSDFYISNNPDVAAAGFNPLEHYILFGASEGRSASADFNPNLYLAANPDIMESGIEPLLHYLVFGLAEGRPIM